MRPATSLAVAALLLAGCVEIPAPRPAPLQLQAQHLPARGCAELAWTVDANAALDIAATRLAVVGARSAEGVQPTPLAIPLMVEGPLERHLARHPHRRSLPITELARWSANHAGHGSADSFWCPDLSPADGAWHVVYVPFAELKPGPNGAGMQNTRLDPASWTVLLVVGGAE